MKGDLRRAIRLTNDLIKGARLGRKEPIEDEYLELARIAGKALGKLEVALIRVATAVPDEDRAADIARLIKEAEQCVERLSEKVASLVVTIGVLRRG